MIHSRAYPLIDAVYPWPADFPTGQIFQGQLVGKLFTGRGSITMRGVAKVKLLNSGVALTEKRLSSPSCRTKRMAALIEKIADMVNERLENCRYSG